jgi:hypothetical protein
MKCINCNGDMHGDGYTSVIICENYDGTFASWFAAPDEGPFYCDFEEDKFMRLENWAFVSAPISPYQAPETAVQKVQGEVYEHGGFTDGEKITTSEVINKGKGYVQTHNSTYELGKAHPDYLKQYPSAVDFEG